MTKILFICHGNICRSPMCEFVMKELVRRAGCAERFLIASAATTTEELGRDTHPGTRAELTRQGIPFTRRQARQLRRDEYGAWDYLVAMDRENLADIPALLGADREGKVRLLLSFAGEEREVADPWYTGDFSTTYRDVSRGCEALLQTILSGPPSGKGRKNAAHDGAAPIEPNNRNSAKGGGFRA